MVICVYNVCVHVFTHTHFVYVVHELITKQPAGNQYCNSFLVKANPFQ